MCKFYRFFEKIKDKTIKKFNRCSFIKDKIYKQNNRGTGFTRLHNKSKN